ncbi:hypothetical protein METBIDRAFT_30601 [Metschnikowia bicuspidata var. bicuspidata NRRL YB-4993]|uniref:Uncharacterized protein n=1 Tax=Metschnikowia bicuspidata var. bicuspidata NRRL YB-4993 TaxID=869754 RepID=A0A1A0HJU0_9ASCO|nr:hypothetical protein METBIDRAFT_30601 [Metschnikowia bicuspidata var. bicuspidata NRRL YB-4993]OBA24285.1 hypothetical protein METBIDRAFT_30601 [Metschnikowia bicuspidata var. bicuspidata NRRL YB-4993]
MDVEHVEYAQKSDSVGFSDSPLTKTISGGLSGPGVNSESLAEHASTTVAIDLDPQTLPVKTKGKLADATDNEWKVHVEPFHSLREIPNKKYREGFVTDESVQLGLVGRNARDIVSQSTNTNSNTVPVGLIRGFFTLPMNTLSSITAIKCNPYRNCTASSVPTHGLEVPRGIHAASQDQKPELASPGLIAHVDSPNPCQGLSCGPHLPPRPAETYRPQRKITPALFHDQFTQFMEDRMAMFQPSSSQNNVEQSLSSNHPYQQVDEVESMHLRNWFTANSHRNSAQQMSPRNEPTAVSVNSPGSAIPINNSTSSFLPRGVQGPCSLDPPNSAMVYTPRAVPLADVKDPPLSPIPSQCMCLWWPF